MIFLLDVNVLIALVDPTHVGHETVHHWFAGEGGAGWATCPITENGLIRIVGHPGYPNTPCSSGIVAGLLARLVTHEGHVFWADDISLVDQSHLDVGRLISHKQVTDLYLLALAAAHGGKLATLDQRIPAALVPGGRETIYSIA